MSVMCSLYIGIDTSVLWFRMCLLIHFVWCSLLTLCVCLYVCLIVYDNIITETFCYLMCFCLLDLCLCVCVCVSLWVFVHKNYRLLLWDMAFEWLSWLNYTYNRKQVSWPLPCDFVGVFICVLWFVFVQTSNHNWIVMFDLY